jgi:hypothetical protein
MKISWLIVGIILVLIATGLLIANFSETFTLASAWLFWAVVGTIYGIGAVLVFGAILMPSPVKKV